MGVEALDTNYDARKYTICAPWYGERHPKFRLWQQAFGRNVGVSARTKHFERWMHYQIISVTCMLAKLLPSTWSRIPAWLRIFLPNRSTVPSFRGVETTCSTAEAHNSRYLLNQRAVYR